MESAKSSSDEIAKLTTAIQLKQAQIEVLKLRLDETITDLSESKQTEVNYLRDQKHFVHFLYQLSLAQHLEELFLIASEQFEMNCAMKPQVFITQYQKTEAKFYEVQGNQVHAKFGESLQIAADFGILSEVTTQHFANFFGRPMGTIFYFKSYLPTIRRFIPELEFFILFESFQSVKSDEVYAKLKSYVDVTSLVLDRQMLRYYSHAYVAAWEKTFDLFKDPICIKDMNGVVIRCNKAFQKRSNLIDDYEIQSHELIDPRTRQIRANIELYINKTEFEDLRKKQVLGEKMTALGKMAGNIAHELNNPLSGILSMCQILKVEMVQDQYKKVQEDLAEIQKATLRCQKIIADLTQFSLGGEDLTQEFRTIIDHSIDVVISLLKSALRRHHVKISLNTANYWVDIPTQLFQQVMFNLINNACQAMEDGGNLEISTHVTERFGNEVCQITILDSGPGIAGDVRLKVFDPFFTTKSKGEGTGLGLHISKLIVEKYRGKIHFETNTGLSSKTKFIVELPVKGSIL
ncbi:MAG: sensor histidine kinase [Pseudobdellovibrionaceae bacterium]